MNQQKKNRLLIVTIFAISIIPVLIAWFLKDNIQLLGSHRTNNGVLIVPPVTTERSDWEAVDVASASKMAELSGRWLIVNVMPQAQCNAVCLKAILATKQVQLMLNKDMLRTRRVVMQFEPVPAETAQQLWLKEAVLGRLLNQAGKSDAAYKEDVQLYNALLKQDNQVDETLLGKLIGQENRELALQSELIKVMPNEGLRKKLATIRKGVIPDGMLLLMDPLGNLMMQYEPGFNPYKVKSDLMQLLRISQIG